MKKINILILIIVISVVLVSCADSDNNDKKNNHTLFNLKSVISIILKNDSGRVITITDRELMKRFDEAIHTAEYDSAQLDIAAPDYGANVQLEDSEEGTFSFWIKEEQDGLFIKSGKNGHYRLTRNAKADLLHMFQSVDQLKIGNEKPIADMKENTSSETRFNGLAFQAERGPNGDLVAKPLGHEENNYMLSVGPVVELHGNLYHTIHFFYGDHNVINALVAHDPSTDEVHVKWSDKLSNSDNGWYNTFVSSYQMLIPINEDHLLFLESELTEEAGHYHLSSYNVITGTIERLREDFWPLTDEYDYLYKLEWNAIEQRLFMQSYLGNVWIFDLKTGEDDVHLLKYRVIPHSTTGVPSLFLSPTFERFVHDDESGQLTFYTNKGIPLHTILLPPEQIVPSEKIMWNPAGTIAWMDQAGEGIDRILDIDIDYLKLAPEQINFYNPDGLPIGSIQAEGGRESAALEVAGWMDANVAVMKSYTVEPQDPDSIGLDVKDVSYFLYDVITKKKGNVTDSMPPSAIVTSDNPRSDVDDKSNIIDNYKEITYKKGQ